MASRGVITALLRRATVGDGRRALPSRFVGIGVAVMLVFGTAGFVLGRTAQDQSVGSGSDNAWLPTDGQGSVSLVNGLTGQTGFQLVIPGTKGHSLTVDQQGTTVLVDDATSGEVIRIDADQMTIGPAAAVGQGTSVFTAAGATYLVDYSTGNVTEVDPVTLRATSAAFHIAGTLGRQAAVAADGTLWIPVLSNGTVVPVTSAGVGAAVQITDGSSANLAMTTIGGRTIAVDQTTNSITVVSGGTGTIELPASTNAAGLLAPASAGGSAYLPILATTRPPSLVLADVADGSTKAVPLGAAGSDQLGSPVIAGDRVYVPDYTQGTVLVYDTTQGGQPAITVTGAAGGFDAQVVNGVVYFNDPNSTFAVTVDPSGAVHRVTKSGPGVPTSTSASQPPSPAPSTAEPGTSTQPPATSSGPTTNTTTAPAPPAAPAPSAPVGVSATSGSGYVDVSWQAPASGEQIERYQVMVSPAGGTQTALSSTSVRVSGLSCSTSYGFTVVSVGADGETDSAAAVYAHACPPPAAPTGFQAWDQGNTTDEMYLTWNSVSSSNGPVSYLVSWSNSSQTTTSTNTVVSGLMPGQDYTFTVRAVDDGGAGPGATYSQTAGLDASAPVQMGGWYTVYTGPTESSGTAWAAPENWKYTAFCQYSGGESLSDGNGGSSTWIYIVNNGVFGWANTLWLADAAGYSWSGLPDCTSPLV